METRGKRWEHRFGGPADRWARKWHHAEGKHGGHGEETDRPDQHSHGHEGHGGRERGPWGRRGGRGEQPWEEPGRPEGRSWGRRGGPEGPPWDEPGGPEEGPRGRHGGPPGPPWGRRGDPEGRRWGRHGGPGGPPWGGRGGPKVGRGDVRAATLTLLTERPMHGYEIIQEITARSGGVWRPSPGSVYPALQLLEDQDLVRSEPADGRRVFHLTDAGHTYVEQHRDELNAAWTSVTSTVDDTVVELHDLLHQVGIAIHQMAHAGTPAQIAAARELLNNTRRQLYRILADDAPASGEQKPAE